MEQLSQDYYNENLRLMALIEDQESQLKDIEQLQFLSHGLEKQNQVLQSSLTQKDSDEARELESEISALTSELTILEASYELLKMQHNEINVSDQEKAKELLVENESLKREVEELEEAARRDENYTGNLVEEYFKAEGPTRLSQQFFEANEYEEMGYDSCLRDFHEVFPFFRALFKEYPVVSSISKEFAYCREKTLEDVEFLSKFGVPNEIAIKHNENERLIVNHFHNNWNDIFESHLMLWIDENVLPIQELVGEYRPLDKKMFEVDERDLDCNLVTNFLITELVLQGISLSFDGSLCFKRGGSTWYLEM